ncbi:MAG TPA: SDR family oxidoreductase [Ktedonobacteraceae bacterium]|nr:SDR family oxidoreductase [Ktedonobacteraceae bacterium]
MATYIGPIGVTGSTGQLGGRVATRLAMLGLPQRLLVRNPDRAIQLPGAEIMQASYEDGPSMKAALSGIQVLFLVSGYGQDRLEQHLSAIDAAVAAGVERIVYTSFLAAAPHATFTHAFEHYLTEQHIRESGCRYTFLRPTFYLDRAPRWFSNEGIIQGPAGNGTITWVSRDDLADVAVAVLTTSDHDGASYEITGTQALTLTQAAKEFSRVTGIPASYRPETIEEAKASRARFNPTSWELEAWVSTYVAIATGEMSVVSHSVEALTGHAPQTFADYLQKHPESYEHITANRV